jgi:hypothetical protein
LIVLFMSQGVSCQRDSSIHESGGGLSERQFSSRLRDWPARETVPFMSQGVSCQRTVLFMSQGVSCQRTVPFMSQG